MEIISRKEAKERGLKYYFTGKPCKHGHVSERLVSNRACCECQSEYQKKWRQENKEYFIEHQKQYREENKEYFAEYNKKYYQTNREQILECSKKYYQTNREQILECSKKWNQDNKDKVAEHQKRWYRDNKEQILESQKQYKKQRYQDDPLFKTSRICRNMLYRVLNQSGTNKQSQTFEALGYSNLELKTHMESLFLPGMSWDNFGDWHIDHLHPVSKFLSNGIDNPAEINALSNLAPMWAEHNLEKGDMTLDEYLTFRPELHEMYGRLISER